MRIIFLGTPEFAVPALEKLLAWSGADVVGLVCQPDRPSGRGQKLFCPPTKLIAQAIGIPVFQPVKLSKEEKIVDALVALKPDLLVMVAFGQILKQRVLEMAPCGVVNIHASLLPEYRGPAPINWAIINGESETGVSTMFSDTGVDTGDILLQQALPIGQDTNAEELALSLAYLGADLLIETLARIDNGTVRSYPQDSSKATYAPLLNKQMGDIDWSQPALQIHNLVRGLYGWPGTYTKFEGQDLKISKTRLPSTMAQPGAKAGQIVEAGGQIFVACGAQAREAIELLEVQPANRQKMPARSWANGARLQAGTVFSAKGQQ